MSIAYSVGLSLLLDTWELRDERRAELVAWLARQPGVGAFRDIAPPTGREPAEPRVLEATAAGVIFVGLTRGMARCGGVSMPSSFAMYIEDLMEADILLPELEHGIEVDAAEFADVLRLEGRTTLRLESHAWARDLTEQLLAEVADELAEECPEDAASLREFCTELLLDLDRAREHRLVLSIGIE